MSWLSAFLQERRFRKRGLGKVTSVVKSWRYVKSGAYVFHRDIYLSEISRFPIQSRVCLLVTKLFELPLVDYIVVRPTMVNIWHQQDIEPNAPWRILRRIQDIEYEMWEKRGDLDV